jgi:Zn-dependent protease with chaperone function
MLSGLSRPVFRGLWELGGELARGVAPGSVALLALALACELPVLLSRSLLLYLTLELSAWLFAVDFGSLAGWLSLLAPFVWPALALACPFPSGWWWRQAEGGREPSEREQAAYQDSIDVLCTHSATPLRLPSAWFVLDSAMANAAVCAQTLMVSRGLLESSSLPAVLAHELGHLATSDGRLSAALNRLLIQGRPKPGAEEVETQPQQAGRSWPVPESQSLILTIAAMLAYLTVAGIRLLFRLARGGYGLRLLAPALGAYWREREYDADDYAASLGQAEELADFLEAHALDLDQPVPFVWLTEHSHPPTELRIARLRAHADRKDQTPLLHTG